MLTDAALKHLKPKEKIYKVTDRDGMYVLVKPSGTLSFRLDYRMNGRRETVTFGKYGPAGLSLARARELCIDAKRAISEGRSPAIEKQREKRRLLGDVDGFDQDEGAGESDKGGVVLLGFLTAHCDAFESLELSDELLNAGA